MLDLFDMYKEEMACQVAVRVVELAAVGDDVELEVDHPVEDDVEVHREPDMFDNEEYVRIDDENIYILVPPSNAQPSTNAQLNDNVPLLIIFLMMLLLKEIFFWRKR